MPFVSCSKFNTSQATQDKAIADLAQAIAGGTAPTGAAGGDLQGTYPNPTVKDQAIADAVTGSTAVQAAVAGVFNRCDGTDMPVGASLIECSAKGKDIPYLVNGVIPATQLPAYVDDVLEFPALANFPATGEAGKIYIDASTGKTYRWNGTGYTEISASAGITVQNEGSVLTTAATSLNFVGAGVQATSSGGAVTVTSLPPSGAAGGVLSGNYPNPNALTITTCGGTPYQAGMKTPNCEETNAMIAEALAGSGDIITATYPALPQFVNSLGGNANAVEAGKISITLPRSGVVNIYAIMYQRSNDVSAFVSHMDINSSISGEIVSTYGYYPTWDNGDKATQSYAGYNGTAGEVISFSTIIKSERHCTVEIVESSLRVQYVI